MHLLVCGKAREIFDEFATMIFSHFGPFSSHFDFQPKHGVYMFKHCLSSEIKLFQTA